MGLGKTKPWDLEKDVSTGSPSSYVLNWDPNLSHATFEGCQGGPARADVVVSKA